MVDLKVIEDREGLNQVREYLKDFEYVAYDCETTGLRRDSHIIGVSVCAELDKAFYFVLLKWDKDQQRLVETDIKNDILNLICELKTKKLIMHNATFDCIMAEAYFKENLIDSVHTDTMILAHLLNENRKCGLKELAKSFYGENEAQEQKEMKESVLANGGVLTKAKYEMYKADSNLMGKYGAKDALLTLRLFYDLVPELIEQGLYDFYYNEESIPLLKTLTYQLNNTGLKIDKTAMLNLKNTLEAECAEAKAFIYSEIRARVKDKYPNDTFNIGSSSQLSWLLFGQMGLEFNLLTDAGKEVCKYLGMKLPYTPAPKRDFIAECERRIGEVYMSEGFNFTNGRRVSPKKIRAPWNYLACDKQTLSKYAPKYKWIAKLLEHNKKQKILSTYVEGILSREQYGVIYPGFLQHGTTSGRYASRDPNFQNLPRDDKRVKSCIISRPGKVFVGADYSQLEPRVFAYFSGDERLLKSFENQDDFYSIIGIEVYGKYECVPKKDGDPRAFGLKYPELRQVSKVIALASTYGATANQLAPTMGKSVPEAREDIEAYFERFPKVRQFMLDCHEEAKDNGFVSNLFGRQRRMPDAKKINKIYGAVEHAELPYDARKLLNLSVNHKIQSTGASIVNRAAIKFTGLAKQCGIACNIVIQVHDSLVVECLEKDAENVSLLLQEAMENTVILPGIKLEAAPKIGKNLSEV